MHPPGTRERFTERLLHVPVLVIHEPPAESPAIGPLPALASGRITFASFNNLAKLNDQVLSLWSAVLKAVPNSQLLLKYVNWLDNAAVQSRVSAHFAAHGIGRERLVFAGGRLPRGRHLELLNRVDVALDPFPFNGCTTTFEALWMGVPVVTLAGERWLGRMGMATLEPIGLGHLAAKDWDGYVASAARLCGPADPAADEKGEASMRKMRYDAFPSIAIHVRLSHRQVVRLKSSGVRSRMGWRRSERSIEKVESAFSLDSPTSQCDGAPGVEQPLMPARGNVRTDLRMRSVN